MTQVHFTLNTEEVQSIIEILLKMTYRKIF